MPARKMSPLTFAEAFQVGASRRQGSRHGVVDTAKLEMQVFHLRRTLSVNAYSMPVPTTPPRRVCETELLKVVVTSTNVCAVADDSTLPIARPPVT